MAGLPIQLAMPLLIALAFSVSLVQANPIVTNQTSPTEETWTNTINSFFTKTKTWAGLTGQLFSSTKTTNSSDPIVSTTEKLGIESSLANNRTLDNFVIQTQQTWNSVVNKTLEFVTLSVDTVTDNSTLSEIRDVAKRIGLALAVTCVVTLLVPVGFLFILCCLGFTWSGVRVLSYAALRQSDIGDVPSRSCFSLMQRVAAGGGIKILLVIGLVFGIPSGVLSFIYRWPDF